MKGNRGGNRGRQQGRPERPDNPESSNEGLWFWLLQGQEAIVLKIIINQEGGFKFKEEFTTRAFAEVFFWFGGQRQI